MFSIAFYCSLFGKSRQAFYELNNTNEADKELAEMLVLKLVRDIRADLPRIGVSKMLYMMDNELNSHGIKLGRDRFYNLLKSHGYMLRFKKRKPYTTNSNHPYYRYPNLIKGLMLEKANQLWVSDITYIRIGVKFGYLSIITDAYSRKIVGYCLYETLHAKGVLNALKMAKGSKESFWFLIHHSDRGVQYCCTEYVRALEQCKIKISMTENGDPYENAIAERINGILKTEFELSKTFISFTEATSAVDNAIRKYNEIRPHASCDYLTPTIAHLQNGTLKKRWRNTYKTIETTHNL